MIKMIVAVDENGGFGKDKQIPWHFKKDFDFFKTTTSGSVCVMGKNTYLDMVAIKTNRGLEIGKDILPNRKCYVVSSQLKHVTGAELVHEVPEYITEYFIIGGSQLYNEYVERADEIYLTQICADYSCDSFFPMDKLQDMQEYIIGTEEEHGITLIFKKYVR